MTLASVSSAQALFPDLWPCLLTSRLGTLNMKHILVFIVCLTPWSRIPLKGN